MNRMLQANVHVNLLFYRRNRLLLVVALLFFAALTLISVPSMLFTSANQRFQLAQHVLETLNWFLGCLIGLIALLTVWYHRSNKCVKLVFARPCPPELWVWAQFVSAGKVLIGGMTLALLIFAALCALWKVPLQGAVLLATAYTFIHVMLVFCYFLALTAWMHPLVAGAIYFIFSEDMFYWMGMLCQAGAGSVHAPVVNALLVGLQAICQGFYYLLPTTSPYDHKLTALTTNLRVEEGNVTQVLVSAVYLVVAAALSFLLTVYSLRKRSMI